MPPRFAAVPDPDDPRKEDAQTQVPGTVESEDGVFCPHCGKKQTMLTNVVGRLTCNRCTREFWVKVLSRLTFVSCVGRTFPWPYHT